MTSRRTGSTGGTGDVIVLGPRESDDTSPDLVVPDGVGEGHGAFHVRKNDSGSYVSTVEATAVRLPNGEKFCKLLRFHHDLPPHVNKRMRCWLSSERSAPVDYHVLDNGDAFTVKNAMENILHRSCTPLTLGQRCGDWFTLRQFLLTASPTGDLMLPLPEMQLPLPTHIRRGGARPRQNLCESCQ